MKLVPNYSVLLFILLQPVLNEVQAQHIEASASRGPVLPIYPDFPESSGAWRWEAAYFPRSKDTTIWNRAYRFPSTGLKLSYLELGSQSLGEGIGLQYLFLLRKKIFKKLDFRWGLGLGGVYFTHPYDYLTNQENIATGSRLAFLVELNAGLLLDINEHLSCFTAFNMVHSSNGHTFLPNVGINVPATQIGLQYHFRRKDPVKTEIAANEWKKRWHFNGRLSLGVNEFGGATSPTNGPKHEIYLTSIYLSRRYSPRGLWQAGLDAYYNSGYRSYLISQEPAELDDSFGNASVLIFFIGHEYIYGHYGLVVQAGYYLHNPFWKYFVKKDDSAETGSLKAILPGKFGVQYYLHSPYNMPKRNLYIGAYIKSNVSQADFLETGIGFSF